VPGLYRASREIEYRHRLLPILRWRNLIAESRGKSVGKPLKLAPAAGSLRGD
jgi:hypothetical protein